MQRTIHLSDRIEIQGGENHDQSAGVYRILRSEDDPVTASILDAVDVGCKERSPGWVNLMDLSTGLRVMSHLNDAYNVSGSSGFTHVYCASKHGGPVNVGLGDTQLEALRRGLAADVNSPLGGFLAFNSAIEQDTAEFFNELFIEGTIAPGYDSGVVELLTQEDKHRRRLLMESEVVELDDLRGKHGLRFIEGAVLDQVPQDLAFNVRTQACVVSGNQANGGSMDVSSLDQDIIEAAQLAINMGGMVASNTILYALPRAIVGIGNGVGNRYFAARNGRASMEESLLNHVGSSMYLRRALFGTPFTPGDFDGVLDKEFQLVAYSDAFFPKADGLIEAIGIDRVDPAFSGGKYTCETSGRGERIIHLSRSNYGCSHGSYDKNLVAKAVVQPGLCLGDKDAMEISNGFGVPMIFMVSEEAYQRRQNLLTEGTPAARAEARKIEGARRFSH